MEYTSYWRLKNTWVTFLIIFSSVVGFFALLFFTSKIIIANNTIDHYEEVMDEVAFDIEADSTQLLEDLQLLGKSIQNEKDLYMQSSEQVNRHLEGISNFSPLIDGGTIVDKNGNVVGYFPTDIAPVKNLSNRIYVQEAIKTKSIYISDVIQARTKRSILVISVPLIDGDEVERVVNLSIHLGDNKLYNILGSSFAAKGLNDTFIVDEQGTIIFVSDVDRLGQTNYFPEIAELVLNRESGHTTIKLDDGTSIHAFYRYISTMEWGIVTFVPTSPPPEVLRAYYPIGLTMFFGSALLVLLIIMLFLSRTRKQMKKLYDAIEYVSAGDYTQQISGIEDRSQVGFVASKFNDMIGHLKVAKEDIQAKTNYSEQQRKFLDRIVNYNPNPIYVMNWDGEFLLVNHEYAALFNKTPEEIIGKKEIDFNPNKKGAERTLDINREVLISNTELRDEEYLFDYKGNMRWFQYGKVPIMALTEDRTHVLYVGTEITELKNQEEQILFQAYHDDLTGMPNRKMFRKELDDLLVYIGDTEYLSALLYFDLDRFKYINDTFGHDAGDSILKSISERLQQTLEDKGAIFRLGGDEFTVLLPHIESRQIAADTSKQILASLSEPYEYNGHRVIITASIGISLFKGGESSYDTIVKQADIAMYQSKVQGKNTFRFYSAEMETVLATKRRLEVDLQQASKRNELSIHYQPIIDNQNGSLVGMEALLRWEHSKLGYISPGTFIPIAEEVGLIEELGEWVLRNACQKARDWQLQGFNPVRLSINLSPLQLKNDTIVDHVRNVLKDTGLDPSWLELEITESSIIENKEEVIQILKRLRALGVSVAIDDFGIGYSSLNSLESLPVDTLKIDKSFMDKLEEKSNDVILSAIFDIAEKLKLTVVAEGIETEEQHTYLKGKYCHKLQGFLFSQPLDDKWSDNLLEKLKRADG
ncbi:EAL domain-containing protein [Radiobacillus kanasensis]|uniref:bifunctional diguanylate cyclase/phosphodiesterase n=1 Tax=Radiobacillus kanasensis TaxID=2844358 RepID=UPI001E3B007E|nr:EAL domain-containing protein [Radiobacillus kanasensis]UFT98729.1 EAL domain-containing protein [Radiobacillus kanasensis]